MNNKLYWQASSYAFYLCKLSNMAYDYRDVVHDAYVSWHKNHGTNLFEQDKGIILGKVKRVWFNRIRSGKYMFKGIIYPKIRHSVYEDHDPDVLEWQYVHKGQPTQEIEMDYLLLKDKLKSILNNQEQQIVQRLEEGYPKGEIAEEQHIYRQLLAHRIHKIRKKIRLVL